jgi:ribosome-associated heat shock protein Hsp15
MEPASAIRLDKWLWHARLCKTRSLAARLIEEGAVRVNAVRAQKPATLLRPGDGVTLAHGGRVRALRVLDLGTRRGPAAEAGLLYLDLDAKPQAGPDASGGLEPPGELDT